MIRLVYILAASHSGSTLLSMLLGSHPQIVTIGEMKLSRKAMGDLDQYRCSCGEFIRECRFWEKVKTGMANRGLEFNLACAGTDYSSVESGFTRYLLDPLHRGRFGEIVRDVGLWLSIGWRRKLREIHRQNAALALTVCEIANARIIVDSSKIALRLKFLLRNPGLDVKVIRLIRDGRAVGLTYMDPASFADAKDPGLRGGGTGGSCEAERFVMAEAARQWRRCNEEAEKLLNRLDNSRWVEIRYEDMCKDTESVLGYLFEFLGLDADDRVTDFRAVESHIVGNGMRLDTTSQISLDERWRSVLTEEELRTFYRVAGRMNRHYGYG